MLFILNLFFERRRGIWSIYIPYTYRGKKRAHASIALAPSCFRGNEPDLYYLKNR